MGDPWAIIQEAAADRRSGAAEIAAKAATALADVPPTRLRSAVRTLLMAHPAMAPLWRLATDVLSAAEPAIGAAKFLGRLDSDGRAAVALAPALPPWVLTISYSSTVLETLRRARLRLVSCMESEPGGEGRRMGQAVAQFARVQVVSDQEALHQVPGAAVMVGADAVGPGGVVNKIKTRALAEAAFERGIPRYAAAGFTKFVARDLPLEEAFERIPFELFTAIAAPSGLLEPAEAKRETRRARIHPELRSLLEELGG